MLAVLAAPVAVNGRAFHVELAAVMFTNCGPRPAEAVNADADQVAVAAVIDRLAAPVVVLSARAVHVAVAALMLRVAAPVVVVNGRAVHTAVAAVMLRVVAAPVAVSARADHAAVAAVMFAVFAAPVGANARADQAACAATMFVVLAAPVVTSARAVHAAVAAVMLTVCGAMILMPVSCRRRCHGLCRSRALARTVYATTAQYSRTMIDPWNVRSSATAATRRITIRFAPECQKPYPSGTGPH